MGYWFLFGLIYAIAAGLVKNSEDDNYWIEVIACDFLGPLCLIWLVSSISQDLIYKKRKK